MSDIASECSVYEATSLLKDYLKQLPDGVLPDSSVEDWMEVLNIEESGSSDHLTIFLKQNSPLTLTCSALRCIFIEFTLLTISECVTDVDIRIEIMIILEPLMTTL